MRHNMAMKAMVDTKKEPDVIMVMRRTVRVRV